MHNDRGKTISFAYVYNKYIPAVKTSPNRLRGCSGPCHEYALTINGGNSSPFMLVYRVLFEVRSPYNVSVRCTFPANTGNQFYAVKKRAEK